MRSHEHFQEQTDNIGPNMEMMAFADDLPRGWVTSYRIIGCIMRANMEIDVVIDIIDEVTFVRSVINVDMRRPDAIRMEVF